MKKFFNNIANKFNKAKATLQATVASVKAEGYVDTGVKIIISVVIGVVMSVFLWALVFKVFNITLP